MQVPGDVQAYRSRANHYTGDRGPWLEHLVEDEGVPLGQAIEALDHFECIPYIDKKHGHMATLLKLNKEVHIAAYRRFRGKGYINPRRLAEFLQPILDREVFLVTKLAENESDKFITHLGFEELGVTLDGKVKTYILNEIKYPRAVPCK